VVPALPTRRSRRGYSAGMPQIRVVLAEDGDLLRAGILALLDGYDDIDVVATATSLPELLAVVESHRPDVVLTDIRMPPDFTDEGIRAAGELRRTHPGTGVVALTQYSDVEYALDLVRDGSDGRGYLLKERVADVAVLVGALRRVHEARASSTPHRVQAAEPTPTRIPAGTVRRPRARDPRPDGRRRIQCRRASGAGE
jgi:DNA-binding NarL/FixJ family response regulator